MRQYADGSVSAGYDKFCPDEFMCNPKTGQGTFLDFLRGACIVKKEAEQNYLLRKTVKEKSMNTTRERAIAAITEQKLKNADRIPSVEEIVQRYGSDVFGIELMRKLLPKNVFSKLLKTIKNGKPLDPTIANDVAEAMKTWVTQA